MKRILAIILVLMVFTGIQAQAKYELPKPKIIAVYFYADWCANCKILGPHMQAARINAELDRKKILFVTMDLTNKATINQSILLAQSLGVSEYLQKQGSATGYVALLDANTKKEIVIFTREKSSADIQAEIEKLLN